MSQNIVRLGVAGVSGRMGRKVIEAASGVPGLVLTSALALPDDPWVGRDLGMCLGGARSGVLVRATLDGAFEQVDVVIDFTSPDGVRAIMPELLRSGCALVSGTTGLQEADLVALKALAMRAPVVFAPNMSLGANVLAKFTALAGRLLGKDYDLEIMEMHHRFKEDAPSGTALALARSGVQARDPQCEADIKLRQRGRIGVRNGPEEVGIGVLRGGDVVGEHTVFFLGQGERIELTHRAMDRMAFAQGAIRAARWVVGKPAGFYGMDDVLGLDS